jgi:pyruvate dehydrogenase E2 component (dihydrolipoamide acetyltransferase)
MSDNLVLPRLSDTMEEGSIVRWLKRPGDPVTKGEPLVEVDTDKVTVVLEAPADGFLGDILVQEGASAKIGATLVYVLDAPAAVAASSAPAAPRSVERPAPNTTRAGPPKHEVRPRTRLRATPLARKLAKQAGLDLAALIPGSGPAGRVLRGDVDRAVRGRTAGPAAADGDGRLIEPTRLQVVLARRMTESKQQIPHYYVTAEVDVTAALLLRSEARLLEPPFVFSLTDLVVRSCALTLVELGDVNSSWIDGKIVRYAHANVGIAVALDDGGLIVPVIQAADRLSLGEIAAQGAALGEKARAGCLTPAELDHGTFTVSNLGMFGVDEFHAIINPPQSGILAIGTAVDRPVVREGQVVVRSIIRFSLSADHRVYSGVAAARFLNAVRARLEHPLALYA